MNTYLYLLVFVCQQTYDHGNSNIYKRECSVTPNKKQKPATREESRKNMRCKDSNIEAKAKPKSGCVGRIGQRDSNSGSCTLPGEFSRERKIIPKVRHHPDQTELSEPRLEPATRTPLKLTRKQRSRNSPEPRGERPTARGPSLQTTRKQRSRDSPEPCEEPATRTSLKTTPKQRSRDSPEPSGKPANASSSSKSKATKTKQAGQKCKNDETKLKASAKSNATVIGKVVKVEAGWASDCCYNCLKIIQNKDKLSCPKCKFRAKDVSDLVVQRLVAEVSLKPKEGKTVKKMCHYPELLNFCKDNGDAITHHRGVEKLEEYLKKQKSLELVLDGRGDVSKIIKK